MTNIPRPVRYDEDTQSLINGKGQVVCEFMRYNVYRESNKADGNEIAECLNSYPELIDKVAVLERALKRKPENFHYDGRLPNQDDDKPYTTLEQRLPDLIDNLQDHEYAVGYVEGLYDMSDEMILHLKELTARVKELEAELEEANEPYFGWCDVEGCEHEGANGGGCWRETGYWTVCHKHSDAHRKGEPQPQMKQSAIDKEATRDPITGYLP